MKESIFYKKNLQEIIRNQPLWWGFYAFYLIVGGIFLAFFTRTELHLYSNDWHTTFGNWIFAYLTYLGDGWAFIILILILAVRSYKVGIFALLALLSTTFVVQMLKNFVFHEVARPSKYFESKYTLNFVEGIDLHSFHSFPSGHTATAFSIFLILTFLTKNKYLGLLFFIAAISASFSRIYLQQHFFIDTYFGSLIAVSVTMLCFIALSSISFFRKEDLQKSSL
jgi:membrane-associated phospholipid phosphatase